MKKTVNFLFLIPIFLIINGKLFAAENEKLTIENDVVSKVFSFNIDEPGAIDVSISEALNQNKLTAENPAPYFEFVINNTLVTSHDPFWIFKEHITREMRNAGTEHQLIFEGEIEPVGGLQIILYQQIFQNSSLKKYLKI